MLLRTKNTPPRIPNTGPQIPNYMFPIIAYTTKNTKWRVRKCPQIPNAWSRNQHQQNQNSCPQITNTVLMWHFKVLYNVHPCSREILALGVSSLCVEQSAYNRSVRHLVPLDNGAVRLAFGHNLVTAFRRLCHRSVGLTLGPRHHPLSHNGQTHAFNSTKSPNWPQSHKVFKMGNSNELKSPAVPPKSAILLPKKKQLFCKQHSLDRIKGNFLKVSELDKDIVHFCIHIPCHVSWLCGCDYAHVVML